ncbi:MAG TPA: prolipoprotein diacylglyceryl transferase, partial [Armatimonadota bacterium]|nr:prolipoprotein diacylglyceryl transferase [Armatimonadota bacterium]
LVVRRALRLALPSGNGFAPALALALAVGRWGCFFGGCCGGKVTAPSLGVRLGDGLPHYPTQIIESLFALGLFVYLKVAERRSPPPGSLWRTFMLAYFTFRFFIEFLRTDTPIAFGLTLAQLAALGVVAYYSLIARPRAGRREAAYE